MLRSAKTEDLVAAGAAAGRLTYVGLFCITLATLTYEILLTRIFSATMWYHFAFVAISVAMFGMTVGALLVHLLSRRFCPERTKSHLASGCFFFALTAIFSFLTHLSIPFMPQTSLVGLYSVALTYVVISVPFIFSGICVCLALTRFPRQVGSLYAADLVGAAVGCIAVIYTLKYTDAPTAVFVVALVGAIGAFAFACEAGHVSLRRSSLGLGLLLAAFVVAQTVLAHGGKPLLRLMWVNGAVESPSLYEKWNHFSRIRVLGDPRKDSHLTLMIDTFASTRLEFFEGDLSRVRYLRGDSVNLCHYLRPNSDVLVIGSGGGRDLLSALVFNQKSAVGVEINGDIIRLVTGLFGHFTGHLDRNPKITFVNDEARSYIARSEDKWDIIQVSLIDTWAATAAGAFVLSENSLYTVEAWKIFLQHLTPRGVLTVTRLYFRDRPGEMYRLTSLASTALAELGVANPRDHILIVRNMRLGTATELRDGTGTILVSTEPFTDDDLAALKKATRYVQFEEVLTPRFSLNSIFASIASGKQPERITERFPINIAAPTDDKPFFFHMLRLRDVFNPERWELGTASFNMKAVVMLVSLLITVVTLTFLCILVPLLLTVKKVSLREARPFLVFFAAIGLGFMLIEISQLQRLILFLGHPTYGLSAVLFALLLSSGLGSFLTRNLETETLPVAGLARLLLLLFALIVFGFLAPSATRAFQSSGTAMRIAVAAGSLFPLGLFMGMAFPLGMKLASWRSCSLTAWFWGINGAASVCASVLAVAIALSVGISRSFWAGFACYVIAVAAFLWASLRGSR